MRLFTQARGTDAGPAEFGEPHYNYLGRSARPQMSAACSVIESWLDLYPVKHVDSIVRRMRGGSDFQFEAAFFELYLHALFSRHGFAVEIHPDLASSGRRPDFLITSPAGSVFLLEASILASSPEEQGNTARLNDVYNAINRVNAPGYSLRIIHYGRPRTAVKLRKLQRGLQQFIDELDSADQAPGEDDRVFRFHDAGMDLEILVRPLRQAKTIPDRRPVDVIMPAEGFVRRGASRLRDKLDHKAKRYGSIDLPFVIAINPREGLLTEDEVIEALFGSLKYEVQIDNGNAMASREVRYLDGSWIKDDGRRSRRVSCLLLTPSLFPWSAGRVTPVAYHNPHSLKSIDWLPDSFRQFRLSGDNYWASEPTSSAAGILGLENS